MIRINRRILTFVVLTALVFSLSGYKNCEKVSNSNANSNSGQAVPKGLTAARTILSGFKRLEAIIVADRPDLKPKWDLVIVNAGKLVDAVDASDGQSAAAIIADILPTVNEVGAVFIHNRLFLIGIAAAEIALDYFVGQIPQGASKVASKTADAVKAFKNRKRISCRDSASGKYRKMSFCEANPSTTQVERR